MYGYKGNSISEMNGRLICLVRGGCFNNRDDVARLGDAHVIKVEGTISTATCTRCGKVTTTDLAKVKVWEDLPLAQQINRAMENGSPPLVDNLILHKSLKLSLNKLIPHKKT